MQRFSPANVSCKTQNILIVNFINHGASKIVLPRFARKHLIRYDTQVMKVSDFNFSLPQFSNAELIEIAECSVQKFAWSSSDARPSVTNQPRSEIPITKVTR
mgnify:CR=1 FL=1